MPKLMSSLQSFSDSIIDQHNVPAVSLAVWNNAELNQAASGLLNLETGVEATTDSVFQIGSITKVMTTCLVMQLVDEGRVDLDTPVKHYLHDFMIANAEASEVITVRQLLNHTSGMAGDFFPDDRGHKGNLIARYVDRCNLLPLVHPPGTLYSYSNSAFVIAGRLVEVVRGISWCQAMENYIFKPLGMKHALADPKELIRYRAAMGHLWDGKNWALSPQSWLSLGMAPCGATPTMSAADLIRFARAHLEDWQPESGTHWLTKSALQLMQCQEISLPNTSQNICRYAGLGWGLRRYLREDRLVFGHIGATKGFYASLQICPEKKAAFALLINGVAPAALGAIQNDLLREVFGIEVQAEPSIERLVPPTSEQQSVVGRYESMDKLIVIKQEAEQLKAHLVYKIDPLPPENLLLYPLTNDCYACETKDGTRRPNWVFVMSDDGDSPPIYLFDGSRLNPRC